ncbi:MAG: diguanylate cyclase [Planctomycetota bacterium]|jgi:diguanylate cyclase (GGDEF)-like protein
MNKKVLIVDDEPLALQMVKRYLSAAGYEALPATNGKEALHILHHEDVQLVITDWVMPEMDGLDFCRMVRSLESVGFVYIIILAAHSDKELIVEAFGAGADDYLSKPFHRGELLARVKAGARIIELEADLEKKNRQILKANAEMAVLNAKLRDMATTDELTGLANRREAWNQFASLWALAKRHDTLLSCLMIDIDEFKNVNDFYGHNIGDAVLQETAGLIKKVTRGGDIVSRIGGEEFLILCPHTNSKMAVNLAERLRKTVEANVIKLENCELHVTISIGIAERTAVMANPDHLLTIADKALYAAKSAGRNRTCIAPCKTADSTCNEQPAGEPLETTN